jgi:hypothetical protein
VANGKGATVTYKRHTIIGQEIVGVVCQIVEGASTLVEVASCGREKDQVDPGEQSGW